MIILKLLTSMYLFFFEEINVTFLLKKIICKLVRLRE